MPGFPKTGKKNPNPAGVSAPKKRAPQVHQLHGSRVAEQSPKPAIHKGSNPVCRRLRQVHCRLPHIQKGERMRLPFEVASGGSIGPGDFLCQRGPFPRGSPASQPHFPSQLPTAVDPPPLNECNLPAGAKRSSPALGDMPRWTHALPILRHICTCGMGGHGPRAHNSAAECEQGTQLFGGQALEKTASGSVVR